MLSIVIPKPRFQRLACEPRPTYIYAPHAAGPGQLALHLSDEAGVVALSFEQLAATGAPATWGDFVDFHRGATIDLFHLIERLPGHTFDETRLACAIYALHGSDRRFNDFAEALFQLRHGFTTDRAPVFAAAARVAESLRGLQRVFAGLAATIRPDAPSHQINERAQRWTEQN